MSNFEQENAATRENLSLHQGHMGTILEHLQTQRDNVVVINQVDATIVTSAANITLAMMDPTNLIVQPTVVIQPMSQDSPSRFVAAYMWGMPYTYNPQFAT